MAELRISDLCGQPGGGYGWSWRAERELPREAEVEFDDPSDEGDEERVRWYLEDYAEFPADPVPALAREAEVPDRAAPLGCVREECAGYMLASAAARRPGRAKIRVHHADWNRAR